MRPKCQSILDFRFWILDFRYGHGAWGMGHGAWGVGHGAWGHGASPKKPVFNRQDACSTRIIGDVYGALGIGTHK
ncbi:MULTISPECIES: hypothetical protein [unclassified Microcoleus]|uniref:hypothetical protein n=1 Tax=unclassified Microcoleus TaxID=2642155 RepID=UPI002FD14332